MKMNPVPLALGVAAALALMPVAAFAEGGTVGVSADVHTTASVGADGALHGIASTTGGVAAEASVHGSATTSTTTNGKGMEVNANAAAGQETAANARENNGAQVVLMQNAAGVTVTTPSQVQSQEDLNVFAENVRAQNQHVVSVNTQAQNRVEVAYQHRAYLFGFIPVLATVRTQVQADANGAAQVTTSHPWWDFLASGDGAVGATVKAALTGDASVSAVASGSASASQVAQAIQAIVQANVAAQTQASLGTQ